MILWEMSHWKRSYDGVIIGEIRDSIKGGERLPIIQEVPTLIVNLIVSCWQQNPRERPTFTSIVKQLKNSSAEKTDNDIIAMGAIKNVTPMYELLGNLVTPSTMKRSKLESPSFFSNRRYFKIGSFILSRRNALLFGVLSLLVLIGSIVAIVMVLPNSSTKQSASEISSASVTYTASSPKYSITITNTISSSIVNETKIETLILSSTYKIIASSTVTTSTAPVSVTSIYLTAKSTSNFVTMSNPVTILPTYVTATSTINAATSILPIKSWIVTTYAGDGQAASIDGQGIQASYIIRFK
jgi:hypothetical protein